MLFRHQAGFELTDTAHSDPGDIFVIADLHCGHANIIRYCSGHFPTPRHEMDSVLIDNWNYTVPLESEVYFLGDLCYGRDAKAPEEYLDRLNGRIKFIRGNHDEKVPGTLAFATLDYDSLHFLLVHDPSDAPPDFEGWVIHGHHHNNNLGKFPFINFPERRINVSAEVIGYCPIHLREITAKIEGRVTDRDSRFVTPVIPMSGEIFSPKHGFFAFTPGKVYTQRCTISRKMRWPGVL